MRENPPTKVNDFLSTKIDVSIKYIVSWIETSVKLKI